MVYLKVRRTYTRNIIKLIYNFNAACSEGFQTPFIGYRNIPSSNFPLFLRLTVAVDLDTLECATNIFSLWTVTVSNLALILQVCADYNRIKSSPPTMGTEIFRPANYLRSILVVVVVPDPRVKKKFSFFCCALTSVNLPTSLLQSRKKELPIVSRLFQFSQTSQS